MPGDIGDIGDCVLESPLRRIKCVKCRVSSELVTSQVTQSELCPDKNSFKRPKFWLFSSFFQFVQRNHQYNYFVVTRAAQQCQTQSQSDPFLIQHHPFQITQKSITIYMSACYPNKITTFNTNNEWMDFITPCSFTFMAKAFRYFFSIIIDFPK